MLQLQEVKKNAQTIEVILRKLKATLTSDFEVWYSIMTKTSEVPEKTTQDIHTTTAPPNEDTEEAPTSTKNGYLFCLRTK